MKKFLSVVLAFLMLAVMLPTTALADETFENMVYSAHENDTINLGDGSFTIPSSAPDGQSGQSVPNNLTFVGNGADKTTCVVSGITSGESTATYFFDGGKKVTFKNVKIDFGPVSDFDGFIRAGNMTFENCIIKGMGANWGSGDVVFNNCTFQYPDTYNEWTYNLWTYSGKSFSFNGCTFETKLGGGDTTNPGKAKFVNVYNQAESTTQVEITATNCTFTTEVVNDSVQPNKTIFNIGNGSAWDISISGANTMNAKAAVCEKTGTNLYGTMGNDGINNNDNTGIQVKIENTSVWENGDNVNDPPAPPTPPTDGPIVIIPPAEDPPQTDDQKNPATGANDMVAAAAALMAVAALGMSILSRKK